MSRAVAERVVGGFAAAAAAALVVLGLIVAPADVVQGQAQRLMYVHGPGRLGRPSCVRGRARGERRVSDPAGSALGRQGTSCG